MSKALTFWGRTRGGRLIIVWTRQLPDDDEDTSAITDYQIIGVTEATPEQAKLYSVWEDEQ
jgi:hypothetical protein